MRAPVRPVHAAIVAAGVLSASLFGPAFASADPATDEPVVSSLDETTTEKSSVSDEDSSTVDSQETTEEASSEEQTAPEEEVIEPPAVTSPAPPASSDDSSSDEPPRDSKPEQEQDVVPPPLSESVSDELPVTTESSEEASKDSSSTADVAVLAEPTRLPDEYWNYGDLLEDGSPAENNFVAGDPTGIVSYEYVDGNIVLTAEGDTRIGVVYGYTGSDTAPVGVLIEPGQSVVLPPTVDRETLYVIQAPRNGEGDPVILGTIYVYEDGTYDVFPYEEGGTLIPITEEGTDPGENPGGETPGGETPGGGTPGNGGPTPGTPPAGGGNGGGGSPTAPAEGGDVIVVIDGVTVDNVTIYEGDNYFVYDGVGYDCTYHDDQLVIDGWTDLATGDEFVGAPEGQSFTTGVMPVSESSDSLPTGAIALMAGTVVLGVGGVSYVIYRRRKTSISDPATYAL